MFNTKKYGKWFFLLVVLAFSLLVGMLYKKLSNKTRKEGFSQDQPFVSKHNNAIYDSYYAMIYDDIFKPKPRVEYEYQKIIEMTQPTVANSIFLDVGSGTGDLVSMLSQRGYKTYGIDKSQAMVDVSHLKYPDTNITCGDANDAMVFDRASFTHICCMNFTIYEFTDKAAFFRNCFFWLAPNGYLILHLADRDRYNPVVSAANPPRIDNPQKYTKKRITESAINFQDFTYKNSANFDNKTNNVIVTETFKDNYDGKVRQNEINLAMDSPKDILFIAQKCGFLLHSQTTYKNDDYQYIFILEKIQ